MYLRGGMTLQALRVRVGEATFFRILRDWATEHRHGNVTTPQFVALAERDSGLELAHFFDVWFYRLASPRAGRCVIERAGAPEDRLNGL